MYLELESIELHIKGNSTSLWSFDGWPNLSSF